MLQPDTIAGKTTLIMTSSSQTADKKTFSFDPKRTRVKSCPCGKTNKDGKFVPYVGYEAKGYCHSCGLTFLPDIANKDANFSSSIPSATKQEKQNPTSFLPVEIFKRSLEGYSGNNFMRYLVDLFGVEICEEIITSYFIGSSSHWPGSTVFYQIDTKGNIRAGKIMLYDAGTGKRVKEPFSKVTWVHTAKRINQYNLSQCLFGEHLLQSSTKPVALVESEKTAIIASVYFPNFTWLATGGKGNLNLKQCQALKGRTVIVFPDLNAFESWKIRSQELSYFATFIISDLLDTATTSIEKGEGLDLADYLIRFKIEEFLTKESKPVQSISPILKIPTPFKKGIASIPICSKIGRPTASDSKPGYHSTLISTIVIPGGWNQEIAELEEFFSGRSVPLDPVRLYQWETVSNIPGYIQSHMEVVKAQNGNSTYLPYLNRLMDLKKMLTTKL